MDNFSTLIGGIAGDGINEAGLTVARLFSRLGYHIYMYYDYPSLIRGGHNFSLVRASRQKIAAHMDQIDVLIALNQETIEKHKSRLKDSSFVIYDADKVKLDGTKHRGLRPYHHPDPEGGECSSRHEEYLHNRRILQGCGHRLVRPGRCLEKAYTKDAGAEYARGQTGLRPGDRVLSAWTVMQIDGQANQKPFQS